jgi:hypothetical protein
MCEDWKIVVISATGIIPSSKSWNWGEPFLQYKNLFWMHV